MCTWATSGKCSFLRVYVKANKHEIEMRCWDDFELHRALQTRSDQDIAMEFGTVDNLGDNQFRYKYTTHYIIHKFRTLKHSYSGTSLIWTPLGQKKVS